MVKSDRPLQIRLTEPVIFLRGPSTGLDFRGRPQVVRQDGQPAMLRGLLTLRLTKPTRIRSIIVRLDGKARTEWPEGIGPRRMDTYEEHDIMSETTTFFSAKRESTSRSRSARRAASLGPGVSLAQWDLDDEDVEDDIDLTGVPGEGEESDERATIGRRDGERGRERGRALPRSASALPGLHDGMTNYHREGFSRRSSFGEGANDEDPSSSQFLTMNSTSLRNRGPSPAYTPTPEPFRPTPSTLSEAASLVTSATPSLPARDHRLSPIASAAPSRAASDRDDSTETERRFPALEARQRSSSTALAEHGHTDWIRTPAEELDSLAFALQQGLSTQEPGRSILGVPGAVPVRQNPGEVRFAEPQSAADTAGVAVPAENRPVDETEPSSSPDSDVAEDPTDQHHSSTMPRTGRAASIRTMDSTHSGSTNSLSHSSHEHTTAELAHPSSSAVQPISALSTAHNSPAPSAPPSIAPSIRARVSTDTLNHSQGASSSSAPPSHLEPEAPSASSSRRSSLLANAARHISGTSTPASPGSSTGDLTEVRQGRKSRLGSTSTIVINNGPGPLPTNTGTTHRPSIGSGGRLPSETSQRSASGSFSLNNKPTSGLDDRGRKGSKLMSALRGLSQDVKDRVSHRHSSKSRTRQSSTVGSSRARTPSIADMPMPNGSANMARTGSGSALPSHLDPTQPRRTSRTGSFSDPNFVPPHGRGGAGRVDTSRDRERERTSSPARVRDGDRSESRGRGRNKGMKVLTGALGLDHHEDEEEDVHNWKEFRKGTYNYPISFPIPVDAPPTIHAEFGSVVYKLKATVVRVGALTPNLVEDLEVMMIATPQEDDLEESENVIVERQWEEQMRYQITLSGKAFPIGGTIPISVRLMPLLKCKVHRLTVALEEKTDYFAQGRKVARHETPKRFLMLFIKQPDKKERVEPLLPIISPDPNAARDSPVAALAKQAALNNPSEFSTLSTEDAEDEMYAQLLDPLGPWHLEKDLQVPDCAHKLKFTSKHEKTNISVSHWLKVTIRVERGDDVAVDAKGRRKQFDIIIETPIKILDCRVNPQWNSLPTYSIINRTSNATGGICTVHGGKPALLDRPGRTTDVSSASGLPSVVSNLIERDRDGSSSRSRDRRDRDPGPPHHEEDTLLERNIVYDRLMSGQETETGEVPPTYGEAVASAARARSASRGPGIGRGRAGSPATTIAMREGSQSRSRSRLGRTIE